MLVKDKDTENKIILKVSIMKDNSKMISNMVKESKLLSKDVNILSQDRILMSKKIGMWEILSMDTNKVMEFNILNTDNTKANGTKALSMVRVPSNTKKVTHIKVNG